MILVTGATGITGREIVTQLAEAGADVRAMVRAHNRGDRLAAIGAELFYGDFDKPDTIATALAGVEQAVLISPVSPDLVTRERRFIAAAQQAGVRRIVKIAGLGSGERSGLAIGRLHGKAQSVLAESGIDWTVLAPGPYMQSVLPCAHSLNKHRELRAPAGDGRFAPIDVRDVGAVTTAVLAHHGEHRGKQYDLTGPVLMGFADMALQLGDYLGTKVRYVDIPVDRFRKQMVDKGIEADVAAMFEEVFLGVRAGMFAFVSQQVEALTGQPPITFREFVADFADSWRDSTALSVSC